MQHACQGHTWHVCLEHGMTPPPADAQGAVGNLHAVRRPRFVLVPLPHCWRKDAGKVCYLCCLQGQMSGSVIQGGHLGYQKLLRCHTLVVR